MQLRPTMGHRTKTQRMSVHQQARRTLQRQPVIACRMKNLQHLGQAWMVGITHQAVVLRACLRQATDQPHRMCASTSRHSKG